MHPLRKTFDLYNSNLFELSAALKRAGGNPEIILASKHFKEVMAVLAANSIRIEPEFMEGNSDGR